MMKQSISWLRSRSAAVRMGILLYGLAFLFALLAPQKVWLSLQASWGLYQRIFVFTSFAVAISIIVHFTLPDHFAERYLKQQRVRHYFYASLLGMLTPGPIYAIYPILFALKRKQVPNALLVSFLTGQTIIGPARTVMELGLFGGRFLIYRLLTGFVAATMAGVLYSWVSRLGSNQEEK